MASTSFNTDGEMQNDVVMANDDVSTTKKDMRIVTIISASGKKYEVPYHVVTARNKYDEPDDHSIQRVAKILAVAFTPSFSPYSVSIF